MRLHGQVAIVTGAGQGIGRAVAVAFAREGAEVVLAARTASGLDALASEIAGEGGRAVAVPTDVTRETSVAALVERVLADFRQVDILVTAAGVASFAPLVDTKTEEWERMLAVNVTGVFFACRAVLPSMMRRRRGTIINIASVAARRPIPGCAAYAAGKHAVVGLSQVLAEELRGAGVRVGVLVPGAVDTPLWDAVSGAPDRRKMLRPEDVAQAAVLMAALPAGASLEELTVLPAGGIL